MKSCSRWLLFSMLLIFQAGCTFFTPPPPMAFDLTNSLDNTSPMPSLVHKVRHIRKPSPTLINEPIASQFLSTDNMVVREPSGMLFALKEVRFSDRLPRLLQIRLVRDLENRGYSRQILYPSEPAGAKRHLLWEIRRFQIALLPDASAHVQIEVAARILDVRSGQIVAGRLFSATRPLEKVNAPQAVVAFDSALSAIIFEMSAWIM